MENALHRPDPPRQAPAALKPTGVLPMAKPLETVRDTRSGAVRVTGGAFSVLIEKDGQISIRGAARVIVECGGD